MQGNDKRTITSALILAAGSGSRMGMGITKQRLTVLGKTVLRRAVEAFERCTAVDSITVVCKGEELEQIRNDLSGIEKLEQIIIGGKTRAESAKIGFTALKNKSGTVLIHDGARCLVTEDDIKKVADAAREFGCATASCRVTDTVKIVEGDGIISTLDRSSLRTVQTPQGFACELYARALENADATGAEITDDNMLVEMLGIRIRAVDTSSDNIKITTPQDLELAEFIIKKRSGEQ